MSAEERAAYVDELRRRWLDGTLEEVLVPEDADLDRLVDDLFPKHRRPPRPS